LNSSSVTRTYLIFRISELFIGLGLVLDTVQSIAKPVLGFLRVRNRIGTTVLTLAALPLEDALELFQVIRTSLESTSLALLGYRTVDPINGIRNVCRRRGCQRPQRIANHVPRIPTVVATDGNASRGASQRTTRDPDNNTRAKLPRCPATDSCPTDSPYVTPEDASDDCAEGLQRLPRMTLYRSRETTPAGIALSGRGWHAIGAAPGAVRSKGQQRVFRRLEGEGEPVALDCSGEVKAAVDGASCHEGGRGELALVRATSEQLGLRE